MLTEAQVLKGTQSGFWKGPWAWGREGTGAGAGSCYTLVRWPGLGPCPAWGFSGDSCWLCPTCYSCAWVSIWLKQEETLKLLLSLVPKAERMTWDVISAPSCSLLERPLGRRRGAWAKQIVCSAAGTSQPRPFSETSQHRQAQAMCKSEAFRVHWACCHSFVETTGPEYL